MLMFGSSVVRALHRYRKVLGSKAIRFSVGAGYFLVVLVYYRLHIVHTTVADFDVVFVKKAVVFMMSWEMNNK